MMNAVEIQEVRGVLQKFQDGYGRRDLALIDDFRNLFVDEDDFEMIGTGAIEPGDGEWCLGTEAACSLVKDDWEGWGDLALDVADARIHVVGDVAWLATTGTVTMDLDPEDTCQDTIDYLTESVAVDEKMTSRERLIEILRGASNTLFEVERGKQYIWPLRFTAVLVSSDGEWRFHQVQFSFATTRFPDVRNA
jgi:hypothetical protein